MVVGFLPATIFSALKDIRQIFFYVFLQCKRIWEKLISREKALTDWYHRLYVSKIMMANGHHDDGSKEASTCVDDPKKICAIRTSSINRKL